jgi:hypothetical protein
VSGAFGRGVSSKATFIGIDSRANSAKWYMAPGHAVAGGEAIGIGGHVVEASDVRARADLGTATSGVLNVAKSNGAQPLWWDLLPLGSNIANNGYNQVGAEPGDMTEPSTPRRSPLRVWHAAP